ncbi:MAG TPA: S-adenosylmethionine decarboxylase [Leptospiraceae bacterium]|nr:S-adenosylmethionine decarboxylase [Leptospirales bacterium]HMX58380.1 S-adenosylmethionine decarboxylase [Leptospiraceae bacterium]HMZ37003.1 S-adenosylmethionine decarboxylase [Leptospiraceae bacterium]HNE22247.1 S-adenosylmethionine decarboxylase [Leptospiraceae bacterium]HNJ03160.1 S-adenosylmethionine decarboxylase [Leptospiraceae bacterium]
MITTKIHNTIQSYLNSKVRRMRGLAGDGLFAARAIKKDELVCMWGGTIYTGEQFEEQPEAMKHYGLQVGENLYIAPANLDSVDDAEYFNHSCEPNCGFRGQAALVAMRDIRAGEELTFDYAMAETYDHPWKCECGSKHCRGTLRGTDHNLPELRDRYRGYFSEWLEKKHADQLDDADYLHRFRATGAWGLDTGLDLHECNPEIIRSAEKIREFTIKLCEKIEVKRFGEPVIVHFGEDERVAGYSLVQLIETSLISAHFANQTNRVYLDVFSCAYYNPTEVAEFAKEFFQAKSVNVQTQLRH